MVVSSINSVYSTLSRTIVSRDQSQWLSRFPPAVRPIIVHFVPPPWLSSLLAAFFRAVWLVR
ncbi:hypothetical protein BKA56DRAFT_586737 [Ilyonectria sp. MPI-CAGE-AT-0026]|nr:hypothetical protein BKA56DRAFT_586737 [Ilyonectria sp. MPI-CAGE-AT-0026]